MRKYWLTISLLAVMFFFSGRVLAAVSDYPKLANYYLGEIRGDSAFIAKLAKYDLLILTPEQIDAHRETVRKVRRANPELIVLAYIPSQSYNIKYWDQPYSVFRYLRPIEDGWWLRDSAGKQIYHWSNLANLNMDPAWSRHLVNFITTRIQSPEVDGIFFDMISESVSWVNGGNIDLNNDGQKDNPAEADRIWLERTEYLLDYAQKNLAVDYIVINGSSSPNLQKYVNGRMFENFPKRWDNSGEWGKIMNSWKKNRSTNLAPLLTIINTNTHNTGQQNDYRGFRYGFATALLLDGYYSYDYGDENHGQLWWYDEYDVNLGAPVGKASAVSGATGYQADVWRREFANGLVLVNSTGEEQQIDLGGEFEKIHGTQDTTVNNGTIVSDTSLSPYDGQVLLKTVSAIDDVLFRNGDFVRFLRPDGSKARNGFFVFESGYAGGVQLARIDLDGNGLRDLLVVSRGKLEAWRDDGLLLLRLYPYTADFNGDLRVAIGDFDSDGQRMEIVVAPINGAAKPIKIYHYDGSALVENLLPLGQKYKGGLAVALGQDNTGQGRLVVGSGQGKEPKVFVYDNQLRLKKTWLAFERTFLGGVNVATGNIDGRPGDEVIVGAGKGKGPIIKIFDFSGKQLYPDFKAYTAVSKSGIEVLAADVDFDGRAEVIAQGSGF